MMSLAIASLTVAGLTTTNTYAATGCSIDWGASCFTTTAVQVSILPGNMSIGGAWVFNFGTFTASSSAQTVSGAFAGTGWYFFVDDLRGADAGYYTTVQLDADLAGPGTATLPRANIFVRTLWVGSAGITTMAGTANTNVQVQSAMSSFQSLDTARQLIIRNTTTNNGIIGKYGVLPQLQLLIPAYQAVGTYTGTITYTLYTN